MNNTAVIKIKGLTKVYKKHKFFGVKKVVGVQELNLEIYENEIFGLLGLNGSGKTTTIKLILGLLHPDSGEIYFNNFKLPDWKLNKHIGYLPELVSFNKKFSAYELLKFYGDLSGGVTVDRIIEVISFVGLQDSMHRKVGEYSKGMLQRLGIAQAILHNPSILIFDEPTSGLDPLGIKEIRDFIVKLKSQGKTIFFSSHLISELEKVCDRVAIIHKGKIARVVENVEWQKETLEDIFVNCVSS
ncbi:MAG: ABC transporter ATP-binding protein [Endomicrobia bacterium]|nr:ABC transporter ATP-binding protein [Endomicrobiia bacterium]MCX7941125.1 ABC transporter ATP-binding protein [Endomicrobiia bacterium]MDW8055271.1 ABC transporter ATP-binding protein [Elusimicrobiota bacterium]